MNKDKECPECKGVQVICNNECGKRWSLQAGTCLSEKCDYRVKCPACSGTGKQPEEKLNIFNLKDRQVDLYDIDPDIAEIMPKIVDELLFGKQPEAPMEYECLSCPNMITDGEYCSECSDTKDGRPENPDIRKINNVEYIRKDKAACCGNCGITINGKCAINADNMINGYCGKWKLRK